MRSVQAVNPSEPITDELIHFRTIPIQGCEESSDHIIDELILALQPFPAQGRVVLLNSR